MALHGAPGPHATVAEVGEQALRFWDPEIGLAAHPGERPLRWYPATRLVDGTEWRVPAGLVEYPGAPEDLGGFDPGPSGAAAALDHESALHSALLETVERDAVIVAWARQQRLLGVDVDAALATADPDAEWAELARTLALARTAGLEPTFARVPLGIDGLVCVVGGVRSNGAHHPLVSLGAKVSGHPATALYGAMHESFQLHDALRMFESADAHEAVVTDETERVRFLASGSGAAALASWLADPVTGDYPTTVRRPEQTAGELRAALLADGLDPYVVDLTDRLPARVRAQGWTVVKVIPVGYQPLRIDEGTTYGWNRRRLETLETRTGVAARRASDDLCRLPHPLP
jgi:ribosomal protein S12 methylthiotransferase accessory factor